MVATLPRRRPAVFVPEATKRDVVSEELLRIKLEDGGDIVTAEQVVAHAEDEDSPLHKYFQWDDTEAARQYRLFQARQLITVAVIMLPGKKRPSSAWVSLRYDRQQPEGGYRLLVDVLSNADQREMLIREALEDLRTWELKYKRLVELLPIFDAIHQSKSKVTKKK